LSDSDESGWPDPPPDDGENEKALYAAKLDVRKKRVDAQLARTQAEVDAELAQNSEYYSAMFDVAKQSIDRARAGAETVQKAATAIVGLYTAVLAVSFSVTDHPLPLRGVIPAFFLGLAVVLATAYLAYLSNPRDVKTPKPTSSLRQVQLERLKTFVLWTRSSAQNRAYALRASVVSLAVALMFLPAPFVGGSSSTPLASVRNNAASWPQPPQNVRDRELKKILFTAQVNEAAEVRTQAQSDARRSTAISNATSDWAWWLFAFVGLCAVFLVPTVIDKLRGAADKPPDPGSGQLPAPIAE
jgi:hypothetical protein